jgi:hypothetical protein
MYANLLAEHVADAHVASDPLTRKGTSVPALDVIATCDEMMHSWRIAITNRHPS